MPSELCIFDRRNVGLSMAEKIAPDGGVNARWIEVVASTIEIATSPDVRVARWPRFDQGAQRHNLTDNGHTIHLNL